MNQIKAFYDKYLRRWVKAIASAVGGAIAGLVINFLRGDQAIPHTRDEWLTLLVATLGPPLLALLSPANKITQKQLDADPNVAPGAVTVDNVDNGQARTTGRDEDVAVEVPRPTPGLGGNRRSSWK